MGSQVLKFLGETDIALCELDHDIEYSRETFSTQALRAVVVIEQEHWTGSPLGSKNPSNIIIIMIRVSSLFIPYSNL